MISEKDFEKILAKYLNGTATELENKWIEQWYAALEDKGESLPEEQRAFIKATVLGNLQKKARTTNRRRIVLWSSLSAAASVLVIMLSIYYNKGTGLSLHSTAKDESTQTQFQTITNESPEAKLLTLEDMTQITLRPNSRLDIANNYNETDRRVSLKGEAFFLVAENAKKPFIVSTGSVMTKVLGTSFTVSAPENGNQIIVTVKTGKVAVSTTADDGSSETNHDLLLTPNQQAVVDLTTYTMSTRLVDSPQAVKSPAAVEKTHFNNRPVSEILEVLGSLYNVDLLFDRHALKGCSITTTLPAGDLYKKLDIICDAIGATYTVDGLTVKIEGNGCD